MECSWVGNQQWVKCSALSHSYICGEQLSALRSYTRSDIIFSKYHVLDDLRSVGLLLWVFQYSHAYFSYTERLEPSRYHWCQSRTLAQFRWRLSVVSMDHSGDCLHALRMMMKPSDLPWIVGRYLLCTPPMSLWCYHELKSLVCKLNSGVLV